jgi:hypothetical protein
MQQLKNIIVMKNKHIHKTHLQKRCLLLKNLCSCIWTVAFFNLAVKIDQHDHFRTGKLPFQFLSGLQMRRSTGRFDSRASRHELCWKNHSRNTRPQGCILKVIKSWWQTGEFIPSFHLGRSFSVTVCACTKRASSSPSACALALTLSLDDTHVVLWRLDVPFNGPSDQSGKA